MGEKDLFDYSSDLNQTKVSGVVSNEHILDALSHILNLNDINGIRSEIVSLIALIEEHQATDSNVSINKKESEELQVNMLDLKKAENAFTLERAKHYVKRVMKGITEQRTSKINDINLNRWKDYNEVITDSLWIFDRRDRSEGHNAKYWGNFVPQIPHQLLLRFTKKGEWVIDPFMGSGTTLIESKKLLRNSVGIDLEDNAIALAQENLKKSGTSNKVETRIIKSDNLELNYQKLLDELNIRHFQFMMLHPPYWDIIKFSEDSRNYSNFANLEIFLNSLGRLAKLLRPVLQDNRYLALVIGDKYSNRKWLPLGFYSMQRFIEAGYSLKSIVVKNYDMTKGKRDSSALWRYRALVGGFYVFKHEYIFLFQK